MEQSHPSWKILTVGDGDLTLSLALARAYGTTGTVRLTASVLEACKEDLLESFPDAPLDELHKLDVQILFGVDATQLHLKYSSADHYWDVVLFHHPHLGLATLGQDEALHATRHYRLLCHYLYSASQVSHLVHVCLCGTQRDTWKLDESAQRHGLHLVREMTTVTPISKIWTQEENSIEPAPAQPHHAAPRRYRNGKLGSRHFLGKYGYRHRRTAGEKYDGAATDMNVAGSMHYVFAKNVSRDDDDNDALPKTATLNAFKTCSVCAATFDSEKALDEHLNAPAKPQTAERSNDSSLAPSVTADKEATSSNHSRGKKREDPSLGAAQNPMPSIDPGVKEYELVVESIHDGKRLRWLLHHSTKASKSQVAAAIKSGRVFVDNIPVVDTGRILKEGTTIVVFGVKGGKDQAHSSSNPETDALTMCYRSGPVIVVDKPSGMRTKGMFPGTLEYQVSKLERKAYGSLSVLDTSCAGICVLMAQDSQKHPVAPTPKIRHFLLALVHGRVPDDWFPSRQKKVKIHRKWKSKKRKHGVEDASDGNDSIASSPEETTTINIIPLERTTEGSTSLSSSSSSSSSSKTSLGLSTVYIQTELPSGANVCQWMRHERYPVVGDSHCRREYLDLKRSIRNRIKGKVCLVSHKVQWRDPSSNTLIQVPAEQTPPPIPGKLSATYWETNFGGIVAGGTPHDDDD